ncbi:unnamed protein product [Caenorhabditis brenneri]
MKKWRSFPVLIKENIVRNMCIPDMLTFGLDLITVDHFSILATSRKFFVDQLCLRVTADKNKHDVNNLIKKLTKARKSLKVKELRMVVVVEHEELITGFLGVCDPSRIESIQIPKLLSQEVYDEIVKTPHWRNSKQVWLNDMCQLRLNLPTVNIDDFLHFENVQLLVDRLHTNDAVEFVQNLRNASDHAKFKIRCQEPMQYDLIRQGIEAGWDGNWQQTQHYNGFITDRAKPDHVFYVEYSPFYLYGKWRLLEQFNSG